MASLAATSVQAATMLITPTFGGSTSFAVTGADSTQYDIYTTSAASSSSYASPASQTLAVLSYYSPNPVYLGGHRVFFKLGDVTLGMLQYGASTQAFNAANAATPWFSKFTAIYTDGFNPAQLPAVTANDTVVQVTGDYVLPEFGAAAGLTTTVRFNGLGAPSAAPEPASWALMITGFGLAGGVLRRRRTPLAA
ncbi:MAG: PEPxxWA-CTERM sorting domain-containing protein [Alphaproteobacteria bacterium]|nr:PEPxxWA-CTERM sorting domain-containing protein [Alphaproteobacteria bacterium]MBU1513315.1 PEPxxWA-CTERM sorting domain-containing protein [Alphaproteobacteria bacterium]MBU2096307.1 PEPxxWA-CTERM sorting domain-containing protein [Alphaproteobacteria bacterium]MBU2152845.1 PEPxxWA-CTERM sorting domain-containing protein [Alphaproteobacteria bacterium]MBU2306185.1 PEPxxWA-CTERM sorting domain-containing protein [Alphaproteobacteria bacterium]